MDGRKHHSTLSNRQSVASDLPVDFTKMVCEVYGRNFDEGLQALEKISGHVHTFEVRGKIYTDEIVMGVTLIAKEQLAATTVYCSLDFDPQASSPTAQDLINVCVDVIGGFWGQLLDPAQTEALESLAAGNLGAMEGVPFDWTEAAFEKRKVWVRVDKANPALDEMANEWLRNNDPDFKDLEEELEEESKGLFVTGPQSGSGKKGNGNLH